MRIKNKLGDRMNKNEIKKFLDKGWILSRMMFEVLAIEKKAAEASLKSHIEKLKKFPDSKLLKENFGRTEKVKLEKGKIKEGYSKIAEIEILIKNLEAMLFIVMAFGPSSVEIIEPKEIKVNISTIQNIMNSVAEMMHKFASQGIGGIIISKR